MDLKQVSEAYPYLFQRGGAPDLVNRENQEESDVTAKSESPQSEENPRLPERVDMTPGQARILVGKVADMIIKAGPLTVEKLFEDSNPKIINPRYV
ncbi:MAG: hypothetical protein JRG97_10580 [Deltaproteobacteria bacterium]|nr:hypothetical protein [Deltaproteobacteria bacterium]MBW2052044.1 hypothetical protein [Deltaproteobacteria bacterium]MBW2141501.1 hypothetical protein [Deltaproteobacteria bacterium]MBW2323410.1 hypothetical protein [Deltaproteobacteria bacterium]